MDNPNPEHNQNDSDTEDIGLTPEELNELGGEKAREQEPSPSNTPLEEMGKAVRQDLTNRMQEQIQNLGDAKQMLESIQEGIENLEGPDTLEYETRLEATIYAIDENLIRAEAITGTPHQEKIITEINERANRYQQQANYFYSKLNALRTIAPVILERSSVNQIRSDSRKLEKNLAQFSDQIEEQRQKLIKKYSNTNS